MSANAHEPRGLAATGDAAPASADLIHAERSIELAPGLSFSTHPLAEQPPFCDTPLRDDALRLWLLRPEWQLLSREDAFARLSPHERKRAKCFPQPGIGKRFAVGRAVLRGILGGMLAVPPKSLEIIDHESGRVTLNLSDANRPIDIAVAYAGIWILIGIGAQPLGLATAFSTGDVVDDDDRHRVRLASVAAAAGTPSAAGYLCQSTDTHAHRVHTHDAGTWRVIDLPMPGRQCIAAVAAREIRDVQASGWNSSVKLPAPPRGNPPRGRRNDAPAGVAAGMTHTG
ncbi:4'-phosphopantetheinyl transferase family protein [Burkholderia sp. 22PA0106]|uniref:4'-phosphopantetheinyl transferase family protein n=1 Tax=Burkholderia sp. 22PA0106 TaxID=3237371 RepID=UPI0039C0FBE4